MKKSVSIVLDTGPVISLAVIDKLELLTQLFTEISIPTAFGKNYAGVTFLKIFPG